MMFFDLPENVRKLLAEVESWRGTPFVANQAVRGGGVDCVHFVESVLVNIGAIAPIQWPRYVISGGGKEMLTIFERQMDAIPEFQRCALWEPFRPGDVLLCSTGRAFHHLAILTDYPTVWHALPQSGVTEGNVAEAIVQKHLRAVYRVRIL